MRAFGVVDLIESVDLLLQLLEGVGEGLLVEVAEQGLVEPLVLALRRRLVRLTRDRLDTEGADIGDELAEDTASGGIQCGAVVGQQPLRDPSALIPLRTTVIAASEVSAHAAWDAIASREWSSMSWKITHLRPLVRTYSVASSCQHAFGAGYPNRRYEERGFFRGSFFATPASRKIRDSDAVEGTGSMPSARIFSCTLIGP